MYIFPAFYSLSKDDAAMTDAADLNRSVLVYHRGAGIDKADGLFIMEKVCSRFHKTMPALS